MRREAERLRDILEAITKIQEKTQYSGEFFEDEMLQVWVVHHLQIIGEASSHISPETQAANPQVPWKKIVGLRNIIVHEYFRTNLNLIWQVVKENLPDLKQHVQSISQAKQQSPEQELEP